MDPAGSAGGLGPDTDHQGVEGDLGPVGPQVGAEGGAQGQRGVRVELAELEVPAELWRSKGTTTQERVTVNGGRLLGGAGDRTSNLPVTSQPALTPEPHAAQSRYVVFDLQIGAGGEQ